MIVYRIFHQQFRQTDRRYDSHGVIMIASWNYHTKSNSTSRRHHKVNVRLLVGSMAEERFTFTEELHIPTPWGYLAGNCEMTLLSFKIVWKRIHKFLLLTECLLTSRWNVLLFVSAKTKLRYGAPTMVFQSWLFMDGRIMQDPLTH